MADQLGHLRDWPLGRMLLVSLGLHAAVIMSVQPRPLPPIFEAVVLDARLVEKAPSRPAPAPAKVPPPPAARPEAASPARPVDRPAEPAPVPLPAPVRSETAVLPPAPAAIAPAPAVSRLPVAVEAPALPSIPVMVDSNWYEARQLDVQPRTVAAVNPAYPPAARRRGIEGMVTLRLRVDEFGVVREAEVEEGTPPGVFDESALEAFRSSRFVPARKEGRPVRALIQIRVRYELDD